MPKDHSCGLALKAVLKGKHIVCVGHSHLLAFADGSIPQVIATAVYLRIWSEEEATPNAAGFQAENLEATATGEQRCK